MEETCLVCKPAYHIAKHDRPHTDHPILIDLQVANGLHTNVTHADIIDHISTDMRLVFLQTDYLACQHHRFSVLIAESTSLG